MNVTANIQQASEVWSLTQFLTIPLCYHPSFSPPCPWPQNDSWLKKKVRKDTRWLAGSMGNLDQILLCCRISVWSWVRQSLCSLTSVLQGWGAACPQLCGELRVVVTTSEKVSYTGCVSISAVLHFTGDRDWKVVHSPARLLFWSESNLSTLPFSYWAVVQSLKRPKACFCLP